jgi:hypothetical protein
MPTQDDHSRRTEGRPGGASRPVIPPPGRRLDFDAWCRVLTAELRRYLPDVIATTNGRDRVTWRLGDKIVAASCDRGVYSIRTDPRWGGFHDSERHDEFTAHNLAKSVAGHFDAKHSIADR